MPQPTSQPGPPPTSQPAPGEAPLGRLLRLMAELRDPACGCAWDVAQTFASIVPYTLEEAYEVADAIERGDLEDLREELGDLLLQVVFHARMAEEAGAFGFDDVAGTIADKLVRRHPHVFDGRGRLLPDAERPRDPAEIERLWSAIKAQERAARGEGARAQAPLAGIARALPALARAEKISRRAAGYGFDWPDAASVVAKVREETDEVAEALAAGAPEAVAEEIGDLLFAVANLARHAGVDPEEALRRGNAKFERRFGAMAERLGREGRSLPDCDLATMEAAWAAVKREEGGLGGGTAG
ncbi:nucleoside triphosphate pyrophosphohydrolase [Methylobacterium oxalidis]|uniref:Nucleoside triphosphate pyrophosphohydrolase n=1 Tax=Methylobacterium oxalidis TaxID=944322 RepID=A0A512J149_9HYPH|nr:nucleoside triphosphate pyrophosphohydrolase [Methylobacterium oxalidis]GEP03657.1 nucleoside triphosphate pyrophosphohydrolase [Methylobacterium oxalidis]GJE34364.1 Nucleoside triphosphate pyrophosphohydrolase [Methylobacterium oxalidis]GLS64984.1 nucleoside triphosphate pyrophosphohydrolase [Methylobacterium oxalidis]